MMGNLHVKTTKREQFLVKITIALWMCGVLVAAITDHYTAGILFGNNGFIHVVVGIAGSSMLIWIPILLVRLFRAPAAWRVADEASRKTFSEHFVRVRDKNEGQPPTGKEVIL